MSKWNEARREYYAASSEKMTAYMRGYGPANRERLNAKGRARRAADHERARAIDHAWRIANADKVAEQNRIRGQRRDRKKDRIRQLRRKHGLTPEEWTAMWSAQSGRCYLCGDTLATESSRSTVVDHDHQCCGSHNSCPKCRRGLACAACNLIIAYASEDPARLRRIAPNLQDAIAPGASAVAANNVR